MASNGNGMVMIKWVIGIIITGLFVLVGNVVGNDLRNTDEHKDIRKDISAFSVEQMRQGTILERIDRKL